jgi:hypothetical protein
LRLEAKGSTLGEAKGLEPKGIIPFREVFLYQASSTRKVKKNSSTRLPLEKNASTKLPLREN